jgi:hypothetical protein
MGCSHGDYGSPSLGILGFGAIHELVEWGSTMALGPERGMLKALADDPYDTQKDLLNNLMGTLLSLAGRAVFHSKRPTPARDDSLKFNAETPRARNAVMSGK